MKVRTGTVPDSTHTWGTAISGRRERRPRLPLPPLTPAVPPRPAPISRSGWTRPRRTRAMTSEAGRRPASHPRPWRRAPRALQGRAAGAPAARPTHLQPRQLSPRRPHTNRLLGPLAAAQAEPSAAAAPLPPAFPWPHLAPAISHHLLANPQLPGAPGAQAVQWGIATAWLVLASGTDASGGSARSGGGAPKSCLQPAPANCIHPGWLLAPLWLLLRLALWGHRGVSQLLLNPDARHALGSEPASPGRP